MARSCGDPSVLTCAGSPGSAPGTGPSTGAAPIRSWNRRFASALAAANTSPCFMIASASMLISSSSTSSMLGSSSSTLRTDRAPACIRFSESSSWKVMSSCVAGVRSMSTRVSSGIFAASKSS